MKKIILMIALGALTGAAIAQESSNDIAKMAIKSSEQSGIKLSVDQLKTYEGTYELMPSFNLKFFVKNGKLVSQATGQEEHILMAQGNDTFTPTTFPASITFIADEDGTFNELVLKQSGQEVRAPKVE